MKRLLLIAVLVVVGIWAVPVAHPAQAQEPELTPNGCALLDDPYFDVVSSGGYVINFEFHAGQVVTLSASDPIGGATMFYLYAADGTHHEKEIPGTITYRYTSDGLGAVQWGTDAGAARWDISCQREQSGLGGGCDLGMDLENAVVGSFLVSTALQGTLGVESEYVIEAGQTAWVLGVDASGMYYKIVWACGYYWVPVSSMGPNFDEVWNGHPLPTTVVK
jgi:hypothetical protein